MLLATAKLHRIQRISGMLKGLCTVFLVLIVGGLGAVLVALAVGRGASFGYFGLWVDVESLSAPSRIAFAALSTVTSAAMFYCVVHLRLLLTNYKRGEVFTAESARHIRHIGTACVVWGLVKLPWMALQNAVSPSGTHLFSADNALVGVGLIVFAISWLMELAAEIREENDLTI